MGLSSRVSTFDVFGTPLTFLMTSPSNDTVTDTTMYSTAGDTPSCHFVVQGVQAAAGAVLGANIVHSVQKI